MFTVHVLNWSQWYAKLIINSLLLQRQFIVSWTLDFVILFNIYTSNAVYIKYQNPCFVYSVGHSCIQNLFDRKSDKRTSSSSNHVLPLKIVFGILNVISKRQQNLFGIFTDNNNNKKEAHHRNKIHLYTYPVQRTTYIHVFFEWNYYDFHMFEFIGLWWISISQFWTQDFPTQRLFSISHLPFAFSSELRLRILIFNFIGFVVTCFYCGY